ncbi:hypothetical protein PLUA15_40048 [Pseudomonas lundensis]|uniref:Uncharacterized protein n=1 Tax=Pseudomonas lundensis TaxID=86185 RepID=A0AAX2HB95_9PSED|nr:hypothetical protein PLUA15_40048 [Pseudomonas lundensis]
MTVVFRRLLASMRYFHAGKSEMPFAPGHQVA